MHYYTVVSRLLSNTDQNDLDGIGIILVDTDLGRARRGLACGEDAGTAQGDGTVRSLLRYIIIVS